MSTKESFEEERHKAIEQYLRLTTEVMPNLAQRELADWPVSEDHCFQRIVLDNVCQGAWYDTIKSPAHQNLSTAQAKAALNLCEQIISGTLNLNQLNANSLAWRKKQLRLPF